MRVHHQIWSKCTKMKTRFEISQNSSKGRLKPTTYKTYQKETSQKKRNSHERTDNASGDLDIILFFHLRISLYELNLGWRVVKSETQLTRKLLLEDQDWKINLFFIYGSPNCNRGFTQLIARPYQWQKNKLCCDTVRVCLRDISDLT